MTRGQIAIITPEGKILTSTEFNGDMYFDGHGKDVYDGLECVENVEDYEELVEEFNRDNFQYERQLFYDCDDRFFNMQDDYFGKWFSDYVYIKNLSGNPVVFTDANGKRIQLDSDTTAVFNFGEFVASSAEDFETRKFIKQLEQKKNDLIHNSAIENYSEIYNMCSDFDNDHHGIYLTDKIWQHDFVGEEVLEYIVKERATDLSRLRCFIGDTYDDDIYILDGYGNLANVTDGDYEELIDDLIYDLENEITVPLAKQEICL